MTFLLSPTGGLGGGSKKFLETHSRRFLPDRSLLAAVTQALNSIHSCRLTDNHPASRSFGQLLGHTFHSMRMGHSLRDIRPLGILVNESPEPLHDRCS